jgi:hypothetical protein
VLDMSLRNDRRCEKIASFIASTRDRTV